jgi:tetratricopeptide (TPR) repeat protein
VTVALVAIGTGLAALDRFLAKVESAELHGTAQRSYTAGARLLAGGKAAEAIDPLRQAHTVERQNAEYELALITSLMEAGKTADARPLMDEMLARQPNDGRVNLLAARLILREAKPGESSGAEAYYHRAIYGEWQDDPGPHRIAVRLELIDELRKRGRKQQLLAELISLEAEPGVNADVRRRVAEMFLYAGSPSRAADIYREITAKHPDDLSAWEGLGEAELEQGQYNAARAAYEQGFFRNPNDPAIRSHLQTLNTVVGLDPTLRKLTSEEKYRRSVRILDMARTELAACTVAGDSGRLVSAAAAATAKGPTHITNEAAESVLSLAEAVWKAENQACNTGNGEDALSLLMKKLAS